MFFGRLEIQKPHPEQLPQAIQIFVIIQIPCRQLLSHCWAKASSHTDKACALISTLAQDGSAISDLVKLN